MTKYICFFPVFPFLSFFFHIFVANNIDCKYSKKMSNANQNMAQEYFVSAQEAMNQKDMVNGIARLTKAIALDESFAEARLLRARVLFMLGDTQGAGEDCNWLLEHVGEQESVLILAARIAQAKGDEAKALLLYNKVLKINPQLLSDINGDFTADGVERRTVKTRSALNPYSL